MIADLFFLFVLFCFLYNFGTFKTIECIINGNCIVLNMWYQSIDTFDNLSIYTIAIFHISLTVYSTVKLSLVVFCVIMSLLLLYPQLTAEESVTSLSTLMTALTISSL